MAAGALCFGADVRLLRCSGRSSKCETGRVKRGVISDLSGTNVCSEKENPQYEIWTLILELLV